MKNEFLLVSPACFLSWCPHKGNSNEASETLKHPVCFPVPPGCEILLTFSPQSHSLNV